MNRLVCSLVVALLWCSATVSAQVRTPLTSATAFPVSIVSPDNAAATAINPSALGALRGTSLTYSHVAGVEGTAYPNRSDGLWFGARVSRRFALGTGLEFMRTNVAGLASTNGFSVGAALNLSRSLSLGGTYRFRSPKDDGQNLSTADVALSFRPSSTLGLSIVGRDLAAHDRRLGDFTYRRSGLLAMTVRPLGDDRFMLELAGLVDQKREMGARIAAQAMVPWVGRLGAAGELVELDGKEVWTVTAGLDVRWGSLSVAPALHTSKEAPHMGWSLLADVHSQPRRGLPGVRYVARIPMEGLGSRALLSTVRALESALYDPRIVGVLLEPRNTGAGLAVAQEIRVMLEALKRAGKSTYCHLELASGSEFYLCAGAARVSMDPAGMLKLMGVSGESLLFGDLLRDVGVRADFVRIGRYKSAPEQYTNAEASEPAREQRRAILDDAYRRLVYDLSTDLKRDEAAVRAMIDRGPFLAPEALQEKLVASEVDRRDLDREARDVFGPRSHILHQKLRAENPTFGPTGQIGVVVIDGAIIDGENVDVPFIDVHMSGGRTVVDAIDRFADDPRIRAIVLRIDSPGGAVMASDQIFRAVKRARARKPVVASMGSVAASGGYYAAVGADEIWASPSTITGSIGIFYGKVDIAPMAQKFGVGIEPETRGAHAGAESTFRPFTDEERAVLAGKIRLWYKQFLGRVAEGRKLPLERVDELARGRVYSGDTAQKVGLIDHLGGFGSALARARELAELTPSADVVVLPNRPSRLLDYLLPSQEKAAFSAIPAGLKPFLAQLALLNQVGALTPLALYEGPVEVR